MFCKVSLLCVNPSLLSTYTRHGRHHRRCRVGQSLQWLDERLNGVSSRVGGGEKADAHFRRQSEEGGVAYVATDLAFMDDRIEDDRVTGACSSSCTNSTNPDGVTSHVVEHNGADEWATTVATQDVSSSGLQEFVHKSDVELSIVAPEARSRQEG